MVTNSLCVCSAKITILKWLFSLCSIRKNQCEIRLSLILIFFHLFSNVLHNISFKYVRVSTDTNGRRIKGVSLGKGMNFVIDLVAKKESIDVRLSLKFLKFKSLIYSNLCRISVRNIKMTYCIIYLVQF